MEKNLFAFEPSGLRILVSKGTTLLEATRLLGIALSSECGGRGICGKCVVEVQPSSKITPNESAHLSESDLQEGLRLACMSVPETSARIIIRQPSMKAKILLDGKRTEEFEVDKDLNGQFGVALDIGTTTLAAYLLDLKNGVQVAQAASLNPQVIYGEDVISRITYAQREDGGGERLRFVVLSKIEELVKTMVKAADTSIEKVTRFSVVGNPAMHHFFLGLETSSLGRAPYQPALKDPLVESGKAIGMRSFAKAEVYVAPNIAGFIGGDTSSFILSQRLHDADEIVLGIDIGTNGEIVLSKKGELYCCSAAAGSAFEGATIRQGMRGQEGAIEYVRIPEPSMAPDLNVIGDTEPLGICGSGIVDLVSELLRITAIDEKGKMGEHPRIARDDDGMKQYLVVDEEEAGSARQISFTQRDVRQVQLAKGAILAGAVILMRAAKVRLPQIAAVYLAGAFGNYIRPSSALSIGLLPPVEEQRVIPVGNAAGEGAKKLLLSNEQRRIMAQIAKKVKYVELASFPDFSSVFAKATLLRRMMPV